MIEDFKLNEPLFQGQIHERQQFTLTYKGTAYHGIFDEGQIDWYRPKPDDEVGKEQLHIVEAHVRERMQQHLQ